MLSQGNICPKATGLQDIHSCPDRLKKPLKRVRKNPDEKSLDDEWVEIEWEEALDYAAGLMTEDMGSDASGRSSSSRQASWFSWRTKD